MAGKAREKFKNIDAQNPGAAPVPKNKTDSKPSKWDKKVESSAEVVNKRAQDEESSDDEDEAFDVKNLMNKFKNIESIAPNKIERKLDELEALRVEAKNLREKFEKTSVEDNAEQSEEKKRQLEEEFRILSEAREKAKQELDNERAEEGEATGNKEDIQIAAEHASKMTAKWEKIQKKEAKKAQKGQMPSKS